MSRQATLTPLTTGIDSGEQANAAFVRENARYPQLSSVRSGFDHRWQVPVMALRNLAGYQTWVHETGSGVRRALFLHCMLANGGAWRGVQAGLHRKLKMTSFDMPGHGKSWSWGGQDEYQTAVTAIAASLIGKRADVIGHSFGATVALRLARDFPDKVRSLTLIEPVLFRAARNHAEYARHKEQMSGFVASMVAGNATDAAREFDAVWGPGTPWDEIPAALRASLIGRIGLVGEGAGATQGDIHAQTAPGALEAINQPVLLMEGSASPPIIAAIHDALSTRLPNVRRVIVAGAGHMLPVTHPEAVVGEVAAFLKV